MDRPNKRSYFRVELILPIEWRILNKVETELVINGSGCNLLALNLVKNEWHEDLSPNKNDVHISRAFNALNNKLDFIIDTIIKESNTSSAMDRLVEISASGLKFISKEKIDLGVFLKMSLMFPGPPYAKIELIAETMRIQGLADDYLIASNIICIDDEARDLLIKLIFQKQRIDIRRIKINTGVLGNDSDVK